MTLETPTLPPTVEAAGSGRRLGAADLGPRLGWVAGLTLIAVVLQVTVMPYIRVAEGVPDIVVALVVAVAVLRGTLVGAVTGFAAGLLVELTAPVGTLGVLALLYLAVGAWCGRYTERPEAASLRVPLALVVGAATFVQLGYAATQLLLGTEVSGSWAVGRVILPSVCLTALLGPPVLLVVRRLLGEPRVVEPYMLPR